MRTFVLNWSANFIYHFWHIPLEASLTFLLLKLKVPHSTTKIWTKTCVTYYQGVICFIRILQRQSHFWLLSNAYENIFIATNGTLWLSCLAMSHVNLPRNFFLPRIIGFCLSNPLFDKEFHKYGGVSNFTNIHCVTYILRLKYLPEKPSLVYWICCGVLELRKFQLIEILFWVLELSSFGIKFLQPKVNF